MQRCEKKTRQDRNRGFDLLVMQAIKHQPALQTTTLSDQLNALFPRLACAAIVVITLCIAGDWFAGNAQLSLTDGAVQLSQQWLLTEDGL